MKKMVGEIFLDLHVARAIVGFSVTGVAVAFARSNPVSRSSGTEQ